MVQKVKNRITSNQAADSNTMSIILWIALVLIVVVALGLIFKDAVLTKGEDIGDKIKDADTLFGG